VRRTILLLVPILLTATTSCAEEEPDFTGVWQPDDGSGVKTIEASGACSGMYYNQGEPLDIGGSMSCTFSDGAADGSYQLVVRQPPNQTSYDVEMPDADTMELSSGGSVIVTLTRQ
jgi:hypothetical protein